MNTSYYTPTGIATASISVATEYNKNPDAEFIAIENEHMDAIIEYFKDHAVYKYCADLTMDGQLKFKGKQVITYIGHPAGNGGPRTTKNSASADDIKKMFNNFYGTGKYNKDTTDV